MTEEQYEAKMASHCMRCIQSDDVPFCDICQLQEERYRKEVMDDEYEKERM